MKNCCQRREGWKGNSDVNFFSARTRSSVSENFFRVDHADEARSMGQRQFHFVAALAHDSGSQINFEIGGVEAAWLALRLAASSEHGTVGPR